MVFVAVVILGTVGVIVVLGFPKSANDANTNGTANTQVANTNSSSNTNSGQTGTEGWKTYRNDVMGYSILYPANWSANTVTDEDTPDHELNDVIIANGVCFRQDL